MSGFIVLGIIGIAALSFEAWVLLGWLKEDLKYYAEQAEHYERRKAEWEKRRSA